MTYPGLRELLSGYAAVASDIIITGITMDSRAVCAGELFCACPGAHHDARDYVGAAIAAGVAAVVYEAEGGDRIEPQVSPVPVIPIKGLRDHVDTIAARFYGHPSKALTVVGITGTNGKTSCAHLLAQALAELGSRCGMIGTLGAGFIGELQTGTHTTPNAISVQRTLRELLDKGATHVAMEVSSHALDQGRVNSVSFDAAVFTNLSHDHLDYHGDLQSYGASKARLFTTPDLQVAVVNRDDPFAEQITRSATAPLIFTFGHNAGDIKVEQVRMEQGGLTVELASPRGSLTLSTGLLGRINADNLAAVAATLLALGYEPAAVSSAIKVVRPVPGRMELFLGGAHLPHVVVDYAHTPDALERALRSVRDHCRGHLWCLFGCGGDRDRGKRSVMGEIARRLADHVVVTNDNPRSEDPRAIAAEIVRGMSTRPIIIHDRARAIDWSIHLALPEDWVLIAGKGHETTQQIGDRYLPHDDRDLVQDLMRVAA